MAPSHRAREPARSSAPLRRRRSELRCPPAVDERVAEAGRAPSAGPWKPAVDGRVGAPRLSCGRRTGSRPSPRRWSSGEGVRGWTAPSHRVRGLARSSTPLRRRRSELRCPPAADEGVAESGRPRSPHEADTAAPGSGRRRGASRSRRRSRALDSPVARGIQSRAPAPSGGSAATGARRPGILLRGLGTLARGGIHGQVRSSSCRRSPPLRVLPPCHRRRACGGRQRPYDPWCVVSNLRRAIALGIALLVTVFTLGSVRVNWTGSPGSAHGAEDPGRADVSRSLDRDLDPDRET